MQLLIDECVDERLRHQFPQHDCQTVRYANLAGLKNGALLLAAQEAGFDVLITVDGSMPYQQNLSQTIMAVVILSAPTNRLQDLMEVIPSVHEVLRSIRPGQVFTVPLASAETKDQ